LQIKQLQEQLKLEQDRRIELDERVRLLSIEVNAHQSCTSTVELLKELQLKITKDYVPKKEVLKLKTEQERKISKVKIEAEKKLADKFCDLDKLLSQQVRVKLNESKFINYNFLTNKCSTIYRWINKENWKCKEKKLKTNLSRSLRILDKDFN